MNLFDISLRFILSKKQLSSTNISIVLSVTTFTTAIAISLIVIGTSRSYSHNVEKEISIENNYKKKSKDINKDD